MEKNALPFKAPIKSCIPVDKNLTFKPKIRKVNAASLGMNANPEFEGK